MTEADSFANRKEYQRKWMAAKRKAVREARGVETLKLMLPKALLAELRARKPKGRSMGQWLPVFLRESLRGSDTLKADRPSSPAQGRTVAPLQSAPTPSNLTPAPSSSARGRNAACSCGSGKKFKNCCGKPF